MLSEIVCSGARQKYRTTKGGTTATHATTTQFETDPIPTAIAARKITIDQAMNSSVLVFSVNMKTSVATGHRGPLFRIARCLVGRLRHGKRVSPFGLGSGTAIAPN